MKSMPLSPIQAGSILTITEPTTNAHCPRPEAQTREVNSHCRWRLVSAARLVLVPRPGVAAVQLTRSEDTLARPRSTRRDTARLLSPRTCTEVTVRTVQRTV